MDTTELIKRCQKNEPQAQQLLYERFSVAMFNLCFRYTAQEMEAEEVLMNGFMKVFKNIQKFENRHPGSLAAWVKRIMINEALNYLRKSSKPLSISIEEEGNEADEAENALEQLQAEDIHRLVRELPSGYRTVFNLYVVEGFSHPEIGEKLGISPNTSKTQLRKARLLLQKKLKKTESIS